jgi:hypothetical protein
LKPLAEVLRLGRTLRVVGFDDAPFTHTPGAPLNLAGVVCADTRLEGLLWGAATVDGDDATDAVVAMLTASKFHAQVHAVLLDGLAFGGFNLVDLPQLAARVERPCVAVMRRPPDLAAVDRALGQLPDAARRRALVAAAGPVEQRGGWTFQAVGAAPATVAAALDQLTDRGQVPEALRLAHLIGSAVKTGQSSNRA